jgi:hypothetical protein
LSRVIQGVEFPPAELAAALAAAGRGELAPSIVGAVLRCFRFDPAHRRYRETVQRYFRIGATCVFLALAALVGGLFVWERRRRR